MLLIQALPNAWKNKLLEALTALQQWIGGGSVVEEQTVEIQKCVSEQTVALQKTILDASNAAIQKDVVEQLKQTELALKSVFAALSFFMERVRLQELSQQGDDTDNQNLVSTP